MKWEFQQLNILVRRLYCLNSPKYVEYKCLSKSGFGVSNRCPAMDLNKYLKCLRPSTTFQSFLILKTGSIFLVLFLVLHLLILPHRRMSHWIDTVYESSWVHPERHSYIVLITIPHNETTPFNSFLSIIHPSFDVAQLWKTSG